MQISEPVLQHYSLSASIDHLAGEYASLHETDMIHGCIKPSSILMYDDEHDNLVAKVSSFEWCAVRQDEAVHLPMSWPWTASEYHQRVFSFEMAVNMDIYSYGMLVL